MKDTDLIIAGVIALFVGVFAVFKNKINLKIQLGLSIICTGYLIIDLILHPESKGKFIVIIGLAWILQNFKKLKGSSQV